MATLGSWALTGTAEAATRSTSRPAADPPTGTVRVFWLKPTDVACDQSLPISTCTDGTPMYASFYDYRKNGILNGPYGSFLS